MPDGPRGPLTPSGPPLGGDRDIAFRKPRTWWQKHLRGILAVVVVVVVVGGITATFLATRNLDDVSASDPSTLVSSAAPSASPSASPSPTPTPTVKPTATAPAKTTVTAVTVVTVVAPGTWTVQVQKGLNLTVVANATTKYAKNKTADDVKKNSSITVVGTITGGVITATMITIEKKKGS